MLTAELVTTPGFRSDWSAMPGSQTALALADAAQQLNTPLLVVSGQPRTSHQLLEACRFFLPDDWGPVVEFPGWEILPYEQFSPHPDLISQRLNILATLPGQGRGLIFTHVATAMQRLPPQSHLDSYGLVLKRHDRLDLDSLRTRLVTAGYTLVSQVLTHGEASIRGGVVDLFPMGSESPFRIDLFDDLVESIKVFDPESQRSTATLEEIRVLPAREFPTDPAAVSQFFRNYQTKFQANAANAFLYRELSNGRVPGGIEFYLPLFFDQTALLTDYLPQHATVAYSADALEQAQAFWNECDDRHAQRAGITERPPLPPDDIFCRPEQLFAAFKSRSAIRFHTNQIAALEEPEYRVASHAPEPYARLAKRLEASPARTLFVADSAGRRELILEGLQRSGVHPEPVTSWTVFFDGTTRTAITTGQLDAGLDLDAPPIRVITEAELFGSPGHRRQRRPSRTPDAIGAVVRDLSELRAGDAVVHVDHGVGSYVGLETVSSGGLEGEFLIIAYAGGDRIYVPVTHLHLIHRYVGAETNPPLHKLGSPAWEKARQRAAKRVRDVAAELLAIYARRAARPG
ncbi:MAG: CarD family transcriptional regulator, partial [Pseudomonadota bacterium]|nr:CarD family transcriptional regulator [Pseudomonadota bacterium]